MVCVVVCRCCETGISAGYLFSSSSDVSTIVGSNVQFVCRTNSSDSIRWNYYSNGSGLVRLSLRDRINPNYTERHSTAFNIRTQSSVLTIKSIQEIDAGRYSCLGALSDEFQISFDLNVYQSGEHLQGRHNNGDRAA